MRRRFGTMLLLAASACVSTTYGDALSLPDPGALATRAQPSRRTRVDAEHREVVMLAGPFRIPHTMMSEGGGMDGGEGGMDSSMKTPLVPLVWPVDGGLQGFRLGLFKGDGTPLPHSLIHHLNLLDFDRRELVYPIPTRLIAVGSETADMKLPGSYQVHLERGDSLGWYIMWNNEAGPAIDDVYVEIVLPYGDAQETAHVLNTVYLDTSFRVGEGTMFDVPPGHSEKSYEFEVPTSGKLLGAGGHLHDYGTEVRLEDVATGKVMFRMRSHRDAEGLVQSVDRKIFRHFFGLFPASVALEAHHPYRIVGVYDNPTGEMIPQGAMAQIGGVFQPDDPSAWPVNDPTDPTYRLDAAGMPPVLGDARGEGHQGVRAPSPDDRRR